MLKGTFLDGDYKRICFIGINRTGKSARMRETLNAAYDYSTHRVLILTQTTASDYKDITRLKTYDQLKQFKSGIALFWDYTCEPKQMIAKLCALIDEGQQNGKKYLQNGGIVFEDCSNYLEHNPASAIKNFLGNHRMLHLDLFFTVHSFKDVSSFLRRRMTHIRIFKTLDTFDSAARLSALDYPNAENIYRCWVDVMNSPNNFENITVKTA